MDVKKFILRLGKAYRRHGPREFIRLSGFNAKYHIGILIHGRRDGVAEDDFDRVHGTETSEIREVGSLDLVSENSRAAARYEPSSERGIRDLIDRAKAGLDLSDFVFVDYGSGKGRVLIIAGQYSFAKIIGVEFSRELNEIAAANIARLPHGITNHDKIRLVCIDAAAFEPPQSHLFCYFYNPFGKPVMAQVAMRLAAHTKDMGYRVIVIYVNPKHLDTFQLTGAFTTMAETEFAAILTTNNVQPQA